MARGQAQYLRIYDNAATYARWQNFYLETTITRAGASWAWMGFECEGVTDGAGADESSTSVTLPATPAVIADVEAAIRSARLVQLETYEFDVLDLNATTTPLPDQTLVAAFTGEVVGASGDMTTITMELGSSLAPVGAQVPPRLFTTRLIGVPAKLF